MSDLVILGRYSRAAALSAVRAGLRPCCVDPNPSVDLSSVARVIPIGRSPTSADWLAALDKAAPNAPVLLLSPLWSDVELVERIATGRVLVGTREAGVQKIMVPAALGDLPALRGIKPPVMKPGLSVLMKIRRWFAGPGESRRWLQAGFDFGDSSGGTEPPIKPWQPRNRTEAGHWLVRRVKGRRLVCSFVGDGWSSVMLGVCERITFDLTWQERKADRLSVSGRMSGHPSPEALGDPAVGAGKPNAPKAPAIEQRRADQGVTPALPDAGPRGDQKQPGVLGRLLPWVWNRSPAPAPALPKPSPKALPGPSGSLQAGRSTENRPGPENLPANVSDDQVPESRHVPALRSGKADVPKPLPARADGAACRTAPAGGSVDGEPQVNRHRCSAVIGPVKLPRRREPELAKLGVMMAQKFDLRGLFSLEMILDRWRRLRPVAVWPAFSPANEVLESAGQPPALAHPALRLAGTGGFGKSGRNRSTAIAGAAWLTAPKRLTMPDLAGRFDAGILADIAPPGSVVEPGGRLCSVHVTADTPAACADLLERLASHVFTSILELA